MHVPVGARPSSTGVPAVVIVCLCNGINCASVRTAVECGATRVIDVHRWAGSAPQCGRCAGAMRDIIDDHRAARAASPLPAVDEAVGGD